MDLVNVASTLRDVRTSGLVYPPSSSVLHPPTPIVVSFPLTMSTNHVSGSYSKDELSSLSSPPPEADAMDTNNAIDTNVGANDGNGNGDSNGNGNGVAQNGDAKYSEGSTPSEARVDGELFAVPANGDARRDDKLPRSSAEAGDADSDEQKAPSARAALRKHLNAKVGSKWTMPTPTPNVDPHGFDDPICDKFWKETWMACAVHNVSARA